MFRTAGLVLALAGCLAVWAAIAQTQEAERRPNKLSQADLEEMLGPIALYPDSLLANVLAASIYPDEVATRPSSSRMAARRRTSQSSLGNHPSRRWQRFPR